MCIVPKLRMVVVVVVGVCITGQSFTIHFYDLINGNLYFTQFDEFHRNSRMFECQCIMYGS